MLCSCSGSEVKQYRLEVVAEYPHDTKSYTQGLFFENGNLYESTGLNGKSTFRHVDLQTGKALKRFDFDKKYFEDENFFVVSGHTPTLSISGKPEIYKNKNNICIDCGATFDGKLACLCLDTMEEFYI